MDPFNTLQLASTEFGRFVEAATDEQWESPTNCGEWSANELVRHVVAGDQMAIALINGASSEEAMGHLNGMSLKDDRLDHFKTTAGEMLEAFKAEGVMDRIVHHPMGDMPASQVLGFRIGEAVIHGWDLACSLGVEATLDPDVVQSVWDAMLPVKDMLGSLGIFGDGASGEVGEDAPLEQRLMDLVGRRP